MSDGVKAFGLLILSNVFMTPKHALSFALMLAAVAVAFR